MLYRMYAAVRFDRELDPCKHFIELGECEVKFDDGRKMRFGFKDHEGEPVPGSGKVVYEWMNSIPDVTNFREIKYFTHEDFEKHFEGFEEFHINTGKGEDKELTPVKLLHATLLFYENGEYKSFRIPKDKLPTFDIEREEQRE